MIDALREIQTEGPRRAQEALDRALQRTAETSRALAHVSHDERHSGDLKASQQVTSEHGAGGWTGSVAYGDRAARFEVERGGEHSAFIDALASGSAEDFKRAMDAYFEGL